MKSSYLTLCKFRKPDVKEFEEKISEISDVSDFSKFSTWSKEYRLAKMASIALGGFIQCDHAVTRDNQNSLKVSNTMSSNLVNAVCLCIRYLLVLINGLRSQCQNNIWTADLMYGPNRMIWSELHLKIWCSNFCYFFFFQSCNRFSS